MTGKVVKNSFLLHLLIQFPLSLNAQYCKLSPQGREAVLFSMQKQILNN